MRAPSIAFLVVMTALCAAAGAQVAQFFATSPPVLSGLAAHAAALADFDRDGDVDLLPSGLVFGPFVMFRNDGLGVLTANALPPGLLGTVTAAFVDYDGDNDDDVFLCWSSTPGPQVALLRYMGGTTWLVASANVPVIPTFSGIVVADLDGDGDADMAGCGHPILTGATGILTNTNGTFTYTTAFGGAALTIAAGDVDGDGDVDIATTSPLQLWRNDGGMVFTNVSATQLPPLPAHRAHLVFGDVDGDGDQDLVLGDPVSNQPDRLLRNDGSGVFTDVAGAIPPPPGGHTTSVALTDVDEDGDLDLLRGGNPHPNLCVNDGTGAFTLAPSRLPPLASVVAPVVPADLDRDGDVDLLLLVASQPAQVLWNRHRHVTVAAPPAIGQSWTVELWGQPGYGAGTRAAVLGIGLARLPQPVVVSPLGALWLDIGAPFVLQPTLIAPGSSAVPLVFTIPNAPSIVGVMLHVQALIEETAGTGDVRLTQLVSSTIR